NAPSKQCGRADTVKLSKPLAEVRRPDIFVRAARGPARAMTGGDDGADHGFTTAVSSGNPCSVSSHDLGAGAASGRGCLHRRWWWRRPRSADRGGADNPV